MEEWSGPHSSTLGYEFAREEEARAAASDLDRRFTQDELAGLRIYRVRWNGNYLVEAAFSDGTRGASERRRRPPRRVWHPGTP